MSLLAGNFFRYYQHHIVWNFNSYRHLEIGCVELVNFLPTGRTYQVYLEPDGFLAGKPKFAEIAPCRPLADVLMANLGWSPGHHFKSPRHWENGQMQAEWVLWP